MSDATYQPLVYRSQGGNELVVASGGAITVATGGSLTVAGVTIDDSTLAVNGLTATASEINLLHSVTAGTVSASKAVVVDASKNAGTFGRVIAATLTLTSLPTSDPAVAGQVWSNSGVLTVSAG